MRVQGTVVHRIPPSPLSELLKHNELTHFSPLFSRLQNVNTDTDKCADNPYRLLWSVLSPVDLPCCGYSARVNLVSVHRLLLWFAFLVFLKMG